MQDRLICTKNPSSKQTFKCNIQLLINILRCYEYHRKQLARKKQNIVENNKTDLEKNFISLPFILFVTFVYSLLCYCQLYIDKLLLLIVMQPRNFISKISLKQLQVQFRRLEGSIARSQSLFIQILLVTRSITMHTTNWYQNLDSFQEQFTMFLCSRSSIVKGRERETTAKKKKKMVERRTLAAKQEMLSLLVYELQNCSSIKGKCSSRT